jgi:hypothetical protein
LLVIIAGSVLAYLAVSITINGQPSDNPFPGWVAVLQPVTEPGDDEVLLQVQSDTVGSHPRLTYTVAACGKHSPYTGILVMGGSARLAKEQSIPPLPPWLNVALPGGHLGVTGAPQPIRVRNVTGRQGSAQLVRINLKGVTPCASSQYSSLSSKFAGTTAEVITGVASAPIQANWTAPFGWWTGPYHSQAWPLTGTTPSGLPGPLGGLDTYDQSVGLPAAPCMVKTCSQVQNEWTRPAAEHLLVNNTKYPRISWSVDTAEPTLPYASTLSWSSMTPFRPMARLTDNGSLTTLQQLLVFAGVGIGIGGAMIASLAFEWLRPTSDPPGRPANGSKGEARHPPSESSGHGPLSGH